jgi:hypothetical protein
MYSPVRSLWTFIYIYYLLISVCHKTIQVYIHVVYMEMKIFENTFPPYEDLQILGILFKSYINPHTTLGNE